jgi:hypothetical protein
MLECLVFLKGQTDSPSLRPARTKREIQSLKFSRFFHPESISKQPFSFTTENGMA